MLKSRDRATSATQVRARQGIIRGALEMKTPRLAAAPCWVPDGQKNLSRGRPARNWVIYGLAEGRKNGRKICLTVSAGKQKTANKLDFLASSGGFCHADFFWPLYIFYCTS